jgi:acetyltransferase-like isoleucine patch superfamily enzyme
MGLKTLRLVALGFVGLLPGPIKRFVYRLLFGYRIAPGVRIGFALLDARSVSLAQGTRIGHLNMIIGVGRFETGASVRIGLLNIIRGGERVVLRDYSEVIRLNVLNAIPDHDCTTSPESVLEVGAGTVITSGHRIDFTDRVTLGKNVIVGGRNSSLWTHNRQETAPIEIGDFCYLGSEVRLAPGAKLPSECILGIGSVLTGEIKEPRSLVAGVPAKVVRPLDDKDLARSRRKTRGDMPDDFYERSV